MVDEWSIGFDLRTCCPFILKISLHDYKYFKGTERPSDVSVDEIIYDLWHEIKCIMLYCRFTDNGDRANWQTDSSPRLQLLGEGNAAQ